MKVIFDSRKFALKLALMLEQKKLFSGEAGQFVAARTFDARIIGRQNW
jgi:hypothetical protein